MESNQNGTVFKICGVKVEEASLGSTIPEMLNTDLNTEISPPSELTSERRHVTYVQRTQM